MKIIKRDLRLFQILIRKKVCDLIGIGQKRERDKKGKSDLKDKKGKGMTIFDISLDGKFIDKVKCLDKLFHDKVCCVQFL